jgi:hypothetical protein
LSFLTPLAYLFLHQLGIKLSAMQIAATCLLAQHPPLLTPVSLILLMPHASRQFLVLTLLSLSLSFYCIVSASLPRPTSAGASNPMLGVPFRVDHRIAHACFLFFSNYRLHLFISAGNVWCAISFILLYSACSQFVPAPFLHVLFYFTLVSVLHVFSLF